MLNLLLSEMHTAEFVFFGYKKEWGKIFFFSLVLSKYVVVFLTEVLVLSMDLLLLSFNGCVLPFLPDYPISHMKI